LNFTVIDFIFVALVLIFIIRCYLKGFISELFSMAAIVLGILASLYFYKNGGEFLRNRFMPEMKTIPEILAFIALFLIVFLVIKLLEIMLKGIINEIKLGGADRFLGIIFGFAEGLAVISLILFVLRIQPLFDPSSILSDSFFARLLLPLITGTEITSV
jgi:membrane protein required for colicin V production